MGAPLLIPAIGAAAGALMKPNNPLQGALLGAAAGYTGGQALGLTGATAASGGGLTASGTALGGAAKTGTALGAQTTGLSTGIGSAAPGTMGVGQGLSIAPTTIGSASNVSSIASAKSAADAANAASTAPEWFGLNSMIKTPGGLSVNPASTNLIDPVAMGQREALIGGNYSFSSAAPIPSLGNYSLAAPSPVSSFPTPTFMERLGMAGKSAYENPMMTASALNAANSLLQPEPMNQAPAMQLQAGRGVKPYDFVASMDPYRQSVISNQPISLLG